MQRDRRLILKCRGIALGLFMAALPMDAWAADGAAGADEGGAPALDAGDQPSDAGAGGDAGVGGKPSTGGVGATAGVGGVNVPVGKWPARDLVNDSSGRACSFAAGPASSASWNLALAVAIAAVCRRSKGAR